MIEIFVNYIQHHILVLGSWGVFLASVAEEILAPIPSAVVIFGSGFLLVSGAINLENIFLLFLKVAVPASLGITVGSLFVYALVFWAGKPVLIKWGKWLGLSWDSIEKLHVKFSGTSFDEFSLFLARAFPIVPSVAISAFCGLVRLPIHSFVIYSFFGLLIRTMILGFVGWQVGKFYIHYAEIITIFENIILIALLVSVICFVIWRIYRNRLKAGRN